MFKKKFFKRNKCVVKVIKNKMPDAIPLFQGQSWFNLLLSYDCNYFYPQSIPVYTSYYIDI